MNQELVETDQLSLKDAVELFQEQSNYSNQIWNFLSLFGAGAVTVQWTATGSTKLTWILLIAYTMFATMNLLVLIASRRSLLAMQRIVFLIAGDGDHDEITHLILKSVWAYGMPTVFVCHLLIDAAVIVTIAAK